MCYAVPLPLELLEITTMFKVFRYSVVGVLLSMMVHTADARPYGNSDSAADADTMQLEEVVVTGQFAPQTLRNSVYKVRVINSKDITQKAATNVQSLLNTELGVRLSNDMALGETDFELMGMSGNNVKVLIDGVPVVDRGANKQSLSQIDINSIERVEIVEGPMSVVYGTDALAGVINIITKKVEVDADAHTLAVQARVQEETAGNEYQPFANNGLHDEHVNVSWAGKQGYYVGGAFTRHASGGWTGDKTGREKQWQPKEQYIGGGNVGYKNDKLHAWYRVDYLSEDINTPINAVSAKPTEVTDRHYFTDRYTHQLQGDWQAHRKLNVNLAASYQDYVRRTHTVITDETTGAYWLSMTDAAQDKSFCRTAFARATALWNVSPTLNLQPGIEYQWEKAGGDRIQGEPDITNYSAFLSAEWTPWKGVNIRPGIRSVYNSVYPAPPVIPSLNTKFTLADKVDLRVSYAYGFRAPALRELYFSFHNANHNIDGNSELKAESSNNFTGSVTWRMIEKTTLRFTTTLSGFYNDFNDRIDIVPDAYDASHYSYGNVLKYKTTGATWENIVYWKNLRAQVNVAYVGRYNNYADDQQYAADDLPQFRFSPEVTSSVIYTLPTSETAFSVFYKFTGARKEYYNDNGVLDLRGMKSFHWADLTVSQPFLDNYITLTAGVKNIFDVTTVENNSGGGHGDTSNAGSRFVGCGRSYFIGLSFNLNHKIK
jgi:outer membrane receptor for ferrienterochelin and colicins